jgi:TolA-binding protein
MKKRLAILLLSVISILGFSVQDIYPKNYTQEEQLILVGTGAFCDGFYDVAEKQFLHFINDYPNHKKVYSIYYLLGKTLLLKGKFREAQTVFEKIVRDNKNFESMDYALFWLAEIEIRLGRVDEARKLLFSIIRRFPRFEWVDYSYYLLGLLDLGFHRLDPAETSFKKVSLLSRDRELIRSSFFWLGVLSFRKKDFETASHYFQMVSEDPKSVPEIYERYALFWLGETHLKLGRFSDAKLNYRNFNEQFKNDPLNTEVNWRIGFSDYRSGNLMDSIEIFQSIKDHSSDSILMMYTHYLLGEIFLALGDYPSSTKEINVLLNKTQGNMLSGVSLLALFWNFVHMGEMEEAYKVFQRLQKLNHFEDEKAFIQCLNAELIFLEGRISDSLPYYFNIINTRFREKALYQMGKGYFFENKFREAITNLDILFLEFPNSKYTEECLLMKAECLNQLGNLEQALETYDMIIRHNKNDIWHLFALIQIGNISLLRHENKRAENAFIKVIEDFPNHPLFCHAAFQLGNLYFKRNNIAEAIHFYSTVLRGNLLELFGKAYFNLGEIFYLQGKYEKAFSSFETGVSYLKENSLWFFLTQLEIGNLQRKWGKREEAEKAYLIILNHSKDEDIKKAARILLNHMDSH